MRTTITMRLAAIWIAVSAIGCKDGGARVPPPLPLPQTAPSAPLLSSPAPQQMMPSAGAQPSVAPATGARALDGDAVIARTAAGGFSPESVRLEVCGAHLCARDGESRVDFETKASKIHKTKKTEDGYIVRYEYLSACAEGERTFSITAEQLAARFENAKGLKEHKQKSFAAAAGLFASAVKRLPTFEIARTNLACALSLQGKTDEAVAVLLEVDGSISPLRYWHIVFDDELSSLRSHPSILRTAPRSPRPGDLWFSPKGEAKFDIAWSKDKNLTAFTSTYQSWGSMVYEISLEIFDTRTGSRLLKKPIVSMNETDPNEQRLLPRAEDAVRARATKAGQLLANLGFVVVPPAELQRVSMKGSVPNNRLRLKAENITVKTDLNRVRILRDAKPLREIDNVGPLGNLTAVTYLIPAKLLFIHTYIDEPEGCDIESDISATLVVPIDLSL